MNRLFLFKMIYDLPYIELNAMNSDNQVRLCFFVDKFNKIVDKL